MVNKKPDMFVININPANWEESINGHRFGIRVDAHHPQFSEGDIFFVRNK